MFSHTVPRKLLDQFAYDDPITKSRRLYRYEKDRVPRRDASPKTSTAWDGYFVDPKNSEKEAELEARLEREFEAPVNQFIEGIDGSFAWSDERVRLLTGYISTLFNRSRARKQGSGQMVNLRLEALRNLLKDDVKLALLAHRKMQDMIEGGGTVCGRVTLAMERAAIRKTIAEYSRPDAAQRDYIRTMETMMTYPANELLQGVWAIIVTDAAQPFVIGDAPVVTWERIDTNTLSLAIGFGKPNVEVFLPISPIACIHILPRVVRTRKPRPPSSMELNVAQAAFATQHCFANINSPEIDAVLQEHFGRVRFGITGFNIDHIDQDHLLFEIMMGRIPPLGW